MSQYVEGPTKTFKAGEAITLFARVRLGSDGEIYEADQAYRDIGTAERAAAENEYIPVRLRTAQGTAKMIANEAIAAGSEVFSADDGEVTDTEASGAYPVGTSLETATADGDIIEVLRHAGGPDALTSSGTW